MSTTNPLRTAPRRSVIIFLLAVFFTFVAMAVANDIIAVGRQSSMRLGLSLFVAGSFAVCYAAGGITLRGKFWMVFIPLFALHMTILAFLARRFPDTPRLQQMNNADVERLEKRLAFDGIPNR